MKLRLVQMSPKLKDKEYNLKTILKNIERSAKDGIEFVAFPELALTGYVCGVDFFSLAEPVPGYSSRKIIELAQKENIYVAFGMPELSGSLLYNSAVLVGPDGLVGVQRKLHLPTFDFAGVRHEEGMYFKPGSEPLTFDTKFGRIGLEICYDIWFPEIVRAHALRGAWFVLNLTAAPVEVPEMFQQLARVRAIESQCWFGFVNQVGRQEDVVFRGGSCIVNPSSEMLKSASLGENAEEVIDAEIDEKAVVKWRLDLPLLRDVRPEIAGLVGNIASEIYYPKK